MISVKSADPRHYIRRLVWTLAVLCLSLPVLVPGAANSMSTMATSPITWIPASEPERRDYDEFTRNFEREGAIIVSWPGCTLGSPGLSQLAEALTAPSAGETQSKYARHISRVVTGSSLLDELTSPPLALSRDVAIDRLQGSLVGRDRETTCAVVVLTDRGSAERGQAIEAVMTEAARVSPGGSDEVRIAGAPVEGAELDQDSKRTLYQFGLPSALVSLGLCSLCLRSWRYTLAIVVAAGFGAMLVLAMIYYSGVSMSALLIVMPPLIFVLTISAGVHLVNYYFEEVRNGDLTGAVRRAVRVGWFPCWVAAATTAIGLGSLLVSNVLPVDHFGAFSPIGLVVTVGLLFLILPGAMAWRPQLPAGFDGGSKSLKPRDAVVWNFLWRFVCRNSLVVSVLSVGVMVFAGWGLRTLETSVEARSLFADGSRILRDREWIEEKIGPLTPVEVILNFRQSDEIDPLDWIELMRNAEAQIAEIEAVEGIMSAAAWLPEIPPRGGIRLTLARAPIKAALRNNLEQFQESKFLHTNSSMQSWRISIRVRPDENADYSDYMAEVRRRVEPLVDDFNQRHEAAQATATYTGALPLTDKVHRLLLRDLYASFVVALVLVGIVMMVILRNIGAGILAMLPNVFPMVVVFGMLGHLALAVDIGTVMTASIALGIAVDDTLHFLSWFRRETSAGRSPAEAVHKCYRHCGRAMIQTTLICSLGLSVFVLSGFVPTQRFCWMIVVLLLTALVGDLIFLPALLVGPVGRLFVKRKRTSM